MTDRDRLIELLRNSGDVETWNYCTDDFKNPDPIESLAIYLIANGVTVNEWRPASEPPKENGRYLVLQKGGYGHIWHNVCKFATNLEEVDNVDFHFSATKRAGWYGYDSEYGYYEIDDITHWMPLPSVEELQ